MQLKNLKIKFSLKEYLIKLNYSLNIDLDTDASTALSGSS